MELNRENIDDEIKEHLRYLSEMDSCVSADSPFQLLKKIKREPIGKGRYFNCTLFEAANRIMTDLVILYGVKDLLEGKHTDKGIDFDTYTVEFGTNNKNAHDITAEKNGKKLIGEAFNVAESFFNDKRYRSLKKLRANPDKEAIKILLYNSDAVHYNYKPKTNENEYHIKVNVKAE